MKIRRTLYLLLTGAALLTSVVAAAPSAASDPLQELYDATYITMREMSAVLPHGTLYVNQGVLTSVPLV